MTIVKIGIDPDFVKSGVAKSVDGKLIELLSLSFPELLEYANHHKDALFVVENVEYDKTTYFRPGTSPAVMRNIAQKVGQVKGTARQLLNCLDYMGCKVEKVRPLRGPVKAKAKRSASYFNQLTGWKGRTNEDKRDAALLIIN